MGVGGGDDGDRRWRVDGGDRETRDEWVVDRVKVDARVDGVGRVVR